MEDCSTPEPDQKYFCFDVRRVYQGSGVRDEASIKYCLCSCSVPYFKGVTLACRENYQSKWPPAGLLIQCVALLFTSAEEIRPERTGTLEEEERVSSCPW